jgi:hypothetical protein
MLNFEARGGVLMLSEVNALAEIGGFSQAGVFLHSRATMGVRLVYYYHMSKDICQSLWLPHHLNLCNQ